MREEIEFVYTENGVRKTSVDENARQNYIDELNRRLIWGVERKEDLENGNAN